MSAWDSRLPEGIEKRKKKKEKRKKKKRKKKKRRNPLKCFSKHTCSLHSLLSHELRKHFALM